MGGYEILDRGGKHSCSLPDPEVYGLSRGARVRCVECRQTYRLSLVTPFFVRWSKEAA